MFYMDVLRVVVFWSAQPTRIKPSVFGLVVKCAEPQSAPDHLVPIGGSIPGLD